MSLLRKKDNNSQHWLTISDLMSGLMILFIFIAIGFMRIAILEKEKFKDLDIKYNEIISENKSIKDILEEYIKTAKEKEELIKEKEELIKELEKFKSIDDSYVKLLDEKDKITQELYKIKGIAEAYQDNQIAIYNALITAFPSSLLAENKLNAEIDENTLTFIFKSSDSLFDNASANLKDNYKQALREFFPRYINAILPYQESISEIRIEGHTSSEWSYYPNHIKNQNTEIKKLYGYFENMKLSQARTNSVLNYVLMDLKDFIPDENRKWVRDHTAAVGLSSSKPILDDSGMEDPNKSRRVTFRIITNADSKIQQILQQRSP